MNDDRLVIDHQYEPNDSEYKIVFTTSSESSNSVTTWLLSGSPAPSTEDSDSDPEYNPSKSVANYQQKPLIRRTSPRIPSNEKEDVPECSPKQNLNPPLIVNPKNDPEYLPPKHVLNQLKKSGDDSLPQSDIIVNVKQRKVRRTKKFLDPVCDYHSENEFSMSNQEEQFFADIGMNTPISIEQLRQILEDSASEESSKQTPTKEISVEDNFKSDFGTNNDDKEIEGAKSLATKMNRAKPPLKIKLRKLNSKRTISPAKSKKEQRNELDTNLQQNNVPKDNTVLPKTNAQKECHKVKKRKRQNCRKQFRHADITLYKLGAGQEKGSVQKNQVIHKIFARSSSTNTPSPSAPKSEVDSPKEEVNERNILSDDVNDSDSNKCSEDETVNNFDLSTRSENDNSELNYSVSVPLASANTHLHKSKKAATKNKMSVARSYKIYAKNKNEAVPQLQIQEDSNLATSTKVARQMANRIEIGKHNLPIRIPERRSSIAEPLRTPPAVNKVPRLENSLKIEVKSSEKSEVPEVSCVPPSDSASISENLKLKNAQLASSPIVKLCRLPDDQVLIGKQLNTNIEKRSHEDIEMEKREETTRKPPEKEAQNQPKPPSAQIPTKTGQTELHQELSEKDTNAPTESDPQNLSIKVVKSRSGITDPLKLHKPHHLQTKKAELTTRVKNNSEAPQSHNSENSAPVQMASSGSKMVLDDQVGHKTSPSILQQNLLLKPGYKVDPYREPSHRQNNLSANSSEQETSPWTGPKVGNNTDSLRSPTSTFLEIPRNMPIIEDANQQQTLDKPSDGSTPSPTANSDVSKKYKKSKRKSTPPEIYEEPPPKLYRNNNYQPYNAYNYPLSFYAGSHQNPSYGALPSFPLNIPPPVYSMCPPIYRPRPRQPTACNLKPEGAGFQNIPRPIINPFISQEPRMSLQPYSFPSSSEAYNTRMNYERLMRFNNSIFANHSTIPNDYTATANRRNETVRQTPNIATQQGMYDYSTNFVNKNGTRQNFYQPFPVSEARQPCNKVTETQSTPLALIKSATSCTERNIPLIGSEELTITKLPLREIPSTSVNSHGVHGVQPKGHQVANLISQPKKNDLQKNSKPRVELNDANMNAFIKICQNNTEIIGPLRYTHNKTEANSKSPCIPSECSGTKSSPHSELASISVSIVNKNDSKHSSLIHSKPTNTHSNVTTLSGHIQPVNNEPLNSVSKSPVDIKTTLSSSNLSANNAKISPNFGQQTNLPKTAKRADYKTRNDQNRNISPYTISDSSTTDLEELEVKNPSASGNLQTCSTNTLETSTTPNDFSLSHHKVDTVESVSVKIPQTSDELLSEINRKSEGSASCNVLTNTLDGITFVIRQMLDNSGKMSEEHKLHLHHILKNLQIPNLLVSSGQGVIGTEYDTQKITKDNQSSSNGINLSRKNLNLTIDESGTTFLKRNSSPISLTDLNVVKNEENSKIVLQNNITIAKEDKAIQAESSNPTVQNEENGSLIKGDSIHMILSNLEANGGINMMPNKEPVNKQLETDKDVPVHRNEKGAFKNKGNSFPETDTTELIKKEPCKENDADSKSGNSGKNDILSLKIKSDEKERSLKLSSGFKSTQSSVDPQDNNDKINKFDVQQVLKEEKPIRTLQAFKADEDFGLNLIKKTIKDDTKDYVFKSSAITYCSDLKENPTNEVKKSACASPVQNIASSPRVKITEGPPQVRSPLQNQQCNTKPKEAEHIESSNDILNCALDLSTESTANSKKRPNLPQSPNLLQASVITGRHLTKCPVISANNPNKHRTDNRQDATVLNNCNEQSPVLNLSKDAPTRKEKESDKLASSNVIQDATEVNHHQAPLVSSPTRNIEHNSKSTFATEQNERLPVNTVEVSKSVRTIKTPLSSPCSVIKIAHGTENIKSGACLTPPSQPIRSPSNTPKIQQFDDTVKQSEVFDLNRNALSKSLKTEVGPKNVEEAERCNMKQDGGQARKTDKSAKMENADSDHNRSTSFVQFQAESATVVNVKTKDVSSPLVENKTPNFVGGAASSTSKLYASLNDESSKTQLKPGPTNTHCNLKTTESPEIHTSLSNNKPEDLNQQVSNTKVEKHKISTPSAVQTTQPQAPCNFSPVSVIERGNPKMADGRVPQNAAKQNTGDLNNKEQPLTSSPSRISNMSDNTAQSGGSKVPNTHPNERVSQDNSTPQTLNSPKQKVVVTPSASSTITYTSANDTYLPQSFFYTQPGQDRKGSGSNVTNTESLKRSELEEIKSAHNAPNSFQKSQQSEFKNTKHESYTGSAIKYVNKETVQGIETNNIKAVPIQSDCRSVGEKRDSCEETITSKTPKRRRTVSNDRNEGCEITTYYQSPYQVENQPYRTYPSYLENEYGRSIRTTLVNQPSEGVLNFTKPSVIPGKLYSKNVNSDHVIEASGRGSDIRNSAVPRQPVIYNPMDVMNRMNYAVNDSFSAYRQNSVRQNTDFSNSTVPPPGFNGVQQAHGSVNTRILADLKEKCLRGSQGFKAGTSVSPETNLTHKLAKENQNNLRLNTNLHNFSNNISPSPDYGYFSPLSKNAPMSFDAMHHSNFVQYNEPIPGQNLQYRRMSSSSQHSATDSVDSYRHLDTILPSNSSSSSTATTTNTTTNNAYGKQKPGGSLQSYLQNKIYQPEPAVISQNRTLHDKISSILPKLQRSGTLTPEQYVAEINMLEKDGCPKPFLEFYSYVTRKQISSNQLPIGFRIFLEFQNAGKLKTFEKAFKLYSERHEKEKKMMTKNN